MAANGRVFLFLCTSVSVRLPTYVPAQMAKCVSGRKNCQLGGGEITREREGGGSEKKAISPHFFAHKKDIAQTTACYVTIANATKKSH